MRIFESERIHAQKSVEVGKQFVHDTLDITRGLVISEANDWEWDSILNIRDNLGADGLRGYMAKLILDKKDEGDPEMVNLVSVPVSGQAIRHQNRYYLVNLVLQSSNCSLAVFCKKLTQSEFWALAEPCLKENRACG